MRLLLLLVFCIGGGDSVVLGGSGTGARLDLTEVLARAAALPCFRFLAAAVGKTNGRLFPFLLVSMMLLVDWSDFGDKGVEAGAAECGRVGQSAAKCAIVTQLGKKHARNIPTKNCEFCRVFLFPSMKTFSSVQKTRTWTTLFVTKLVIFGYNRIVRASLIHDFTSDQR